MVKVLLKFPEAFYRTCGWLVFNLKRVQLSLEPKRMSLLKDTAMAFLNTTETLSFRKYEFSVLNWYANSRNRISHKVIKGTLLPLQKNIKDLGTFISVLDFYTHHECYLIIYVILFLTIRYAKFYECKIQ